ncbi:MULTISPECIES: DUF4192 family protein [unclassified Rathayibacter]|uniref:DUF4192 family protein n=1 Tax=unclassified Rathayibacter TaxID=2609250 RepID=UPI001E57E41E|nr:MULTISPECIES: DUF4192 family protein [unclassified Rathayibacter]
MSSFERTSSVPSASPREPEIVRASELHDVLAAVPALIGLRPVESLVVLPLLGSRAVGGFRIALPSRMRRAEVEEVARRCVRAMERMPQATGVLIAVYTRRTYAECRGIPFIDLGRAVVSRLERTRLRIVAVACVAGDGWGRYTDRFDARTPRPLLEIEGSDVGLFASASAPDPLDVETLSALPEVTAADRAVVEEVLGRDVPLVLDIVALVERWLATPPTPQREARVIQILQSPALRDQTTLQIALGAGMAGEAAARRRQLDAIGVVTGESVSEVAVREFDAGGLSAHDVAASSLLMGRGTAPDQKRLELATAALARLAALAPVESRVPVLTVLAWCWWARGVASLAHAHLDEALRLDPSYSMAQLYSSLFVAISVPEWVVAGASRALSEAAARV